MCNHTFGSYIKRRDLQQTLSQLETMGLKTAGLIIACFVGMVYAPPPGQYGQQNQRRTQQGGYQQTGYQQGGTQQTGYQPGGYQPGGYQHTGSQQGCPPYHGGPHHGPPPTRFPACRDYDTKIYNELRGKLYFTTF